MHIGHSGQLCSFLITTKWTYNLIGKNFWCLTKIRLLLLYAPPPSKYYLTSFLCFKSGKIQRTYTQIIFFEWPISAQHIGYPKRKHIQVWNIKADLENELIFTVGIYMFLLTGKCKLVLTKGLHNIFNTLCRLWCTCDSLLISWSDSWLVPCITTLVMMELKSSVIWVFCSSTCCSSCTHQWPSPSSHVSISCCNPHKQKVLSE